MVETERKFLLKPGAEIPINNKGVSIKQGYLSVEPESTVRIRVTGENAFITIKGKVKGISRPEFEYTIPKPDAETLLRLCRNYIIEKTRYKILIGTLVWEVDVFEGENLGLILAEVELENENQEIEIPEWIGEEVSFDHRYFNSYLSVNPYSKWK